MEAARFRVEPPRRRSSLPFPSLDVGVSCLNGGAGWKVSRLVPSPERWGACRRGGEVRHEQRCVDLAVEMLAAAKVGSKGPELSFGAAVALANALNNRMQLAQTLAAFGEDDDDDEIL